MAALSSYTPIATYTVPSGTPISYTFTSIPQTYTDLILVTSFAGNYPSNDRSQLGIQVGNGSVDTGSNYSVTSMTGNGSTATSSRNTSLNQLSLATFPLGPSSSLQQNDLIVHFQNYSNTTTNKTVLARATQMNSSNNTPSTVAEVGLWRSTSAIDTIKIKDYADLYYFYAGTTFSLYGIANNTAGAKATGGVISSDDTYFYHSFYATGTFTPTQSLSCDYLVVAGGGGGASGYGGGGGGGAGGLRSTVTTTGAGGSLETPLSVTAQAYTITVGAGGAGGANGASNNGTIGGNSVFSSITSTGGGFGGASSTAGNGGSGGGAGWQYPTAGTGTTGQGRSGGAGANDGAGAAGGGGGGGADTAGTAGTTSAPGNGGAGVATSISGLSVTYAGGGGAGRNDAGTLSSGGTGGGGTGGGNNIDNAVAGTANLGGGGGAGGGGYKPGKAGGSGVVIIRYAR